MEGWYYVIALWLARLAVTFVLGLMVLGSFIIGAKSKFR